MSGDIYQTGRKSVVRAGILFSTIISVFLIALIFLIALSRIDDDFYAVMEKNHLLESWLTIMLAVSMLMFMYFYDRANPTNQKKTS